MGSGTVRPTDATTSHGAQLCPRPLLLISECKLNLSCQRLFCTIYLPSAWQIRSVKQPRRHLQIFISFIISSWQSPEPHLQLHLLLQQSPGGGMPSCDGWDTDRTVHRGCTHTALGAHTQPWVHTHSSGCTHSHVPDAHLELPSCCPPPAACRGGGGSRDAVQLSPGGGDGRGRVLQHSLPPVWCRQRFPGAAE